MIQPAPPTAPVVPPVSVVFPTTPPGPLTVVPPIAIDSKPLPAAQSSYDVDLHEPKATDTYETICKEFYNDAKYGTALRHYNGDRQLQANVRVEVPPIHVLKRRFPQYIEKTPLVLPTGRTGADGWGAAAGSRTFTVPTGGMTMANAAREALGTATRWRDIYDLNPQLSPADLLPAGTQLKLPTDVKPAN